MSSVYRVSECLEWDHIHILRLKLKVLFFNSIEERQNRTHFPVSVFLVNFRGTGRKNKVSAGV